MFNFNNINRKFLCLYLNSHIEKIYFGVSAEPNLITVEDREKFEYKIIRLKNIYSLMETEYCSIIEQYLNKFHNYQIIKF